MHANKRSKVNGMNIAHSSFHYARTPHPKSEFLYDLRHQESLLQLAIRQLLFAASLVSFPPSLYRLLWLVCFLLALQVMMKGDLVILRLGFCPVTYLS